MNSRSVTFAILAYNQERLILEALESIRYQVEKYGSTNGYSYSIVAIDDGSRDDTVKILNEWIECNRFLFKEARVIVHDINMGTVFSYSQLMREVKTEFFLEMAGDDVISSTDITTYITSSHNVISVYPGFFLRGESVFLRDTNYCVSFFYFLTHKKSKKYLLSIFAMGLLPYQAINGVRDLSLYDEADCELFNKKFRLVEDAPTIYKILRDISNIDIEFKLCPPFYLYRINEDSVTHSSSTNDIYINDLVTLFSEYEEQCDGLLKIYFRNKKKRLHGESNIPICSFIDRFCYLYFFINSAWLHKKGYKKYIELLKERCPIETNHYLNIKTKAELFYRNHCTI